MAIFMGVWVTIFVTAYNAHTPVHPRTTYHQGAYRRIVYSFLDKHSRLGSLPNQFLSRARLTTPCACILPKRAQARLKQGLQTGFAGCSRASLTLWNFCKNKIYVWGGNPSFQQQTPTKAGQAHPTRNNHVPPAVRHRIPSSHTGCRHIQHKRDELSPVARSGTVWNTLKRLAGDS